MCSTESYNAVCEARGRGRPGAAAAARAARLSRGEALADGVLPASDAGEPARCGGDRRADGCRRALSALGLLEALWPAAGGRLPMESQARASRVLRPALESAATNDAPGAAAHSAAVGRTAGVESDLGARLHDRDALRQPARAPAHRARQIGRAHV